MKLRDISTVLALAMLLTGNAMAAGYTQSENPIGQQAWWWDAAFWDAGQLPVPNNYEVEERWIEYENGDTTVPAMVVKPVGEGKWPAVLFQHGRRGLDELLQRKVRRIAARGFVVLAPDVFGARFIEKFPIGHDYVVEGDVNAGLDVLLDLPEVGTDRACLVSHTRGGYMTLKVAVTFERQQDAAACYVSWYPHLQDPNAPEPMQVYRYATEADELAIPALIFIGDEEQYQRRRSIETAVDSLRKAGKPVRLVIYPGVGRGFDFRPPNVRTFADDLAAKDALMRAAAFIREHLAPYAKAAPGSP
jgi:carboxymethylenebutenolidase